MRTSTRRMVEQNYEYHANLHEHHKARHEENVVALKEQQKEARRQIRAARGKDAKEDAKEEAAEDIAEVEMAATEDEILRDLHGDVATQLREALGEPVAPAIQTARENRPVVRQARFRPVSRRVQ